MPLKPSGLSKIKFLHIAKIDGEDLYDWTQDNKPISAYKLDILAVKSIVKASDIYYQINRRDLKICFIMKEEILFIIGADEKIQFQLLEAIVDDICDQFFEYYGDMVMKFSGGLSDAFNGFSDNIINIIQKIKKKVTYVRAYCKVCKGHLEICVKNSFVDDASDYPVSMVYIHEGHGLLIYIDASYRVRGAEIVKTTG
ncbi:MAG: hypothetical protein GF364_05180 [Candidatus Lokiarchaeota archaeon]|nr:hypothetical protein [Candidatus Lokiarchaeota archaeon]